LGPWASSASARKRPPATGHSVLRPPRFHCQAIARAVQHGPAAPTRSWGTSLAGFQVLHDDAGGRRRSPARCRRWSRCRRSAGVGRDHVGIGDIQRGGIAASRDFGHDRRSVPADSSGVGARSASCPARTAARRPPPPHPSAARTAASASAAPGARFIDR
jgi:hypothetical protein